MRFVFKTEDVSSNFFMNFILNTKNSLYQLRGIATGTTSVAAIYTRDLIKIKIPVPTKAEQIAIATALNDADALITQLEKLIAKKGNIKQGAMQELLKPKEGWVTKKLGEIFKFLNTANNARADLLESGEVEYIHYGDIHTRWNCFLNCSKNELPFIDKGKISGVPLLENGDLVIADASEDYEGLGACIEIKNIGKRKIIAGLHTLLLRCDKNILADGFKGYLRNYKGVKDALIRVSTGVSVFGISKTNLKEIEISIPSTIKEQTNITQILSDMDTEIEALKKKLEKYKMIKEGMMQNLLTGKIRLV
ncbi:MAG: restriction endonuclease subunit S [Candidatus Scalindua sp.]|nr:restriction endonuclease subunit S [Candidatus Scalindua sp.]